MHGLFDGLPVEGWDAVLVVGEEPLRAFDAYLQQAAATGFDWFAAWSSSGPCLAETDAPLRADRGLEEVALTKTRTRATRVHCAVSARRALGNGRADVVHVELFVGPPRDCALPCEQSYASYLEISVAHGQPGSGGVLDDASARPTPPDVASLRMPELPPPAENLRLPRVGERVGLDHRFFGSLVVEPASRVLAPGAALNTGGTGNYTLLLRITGDPSVVLSAYGRQFERACCGAGAFELGTQTAEGTELLQGGVEELGGVSIFVRTTALVGDAPVFARIDITSD